MASPNVPYLIAALFLEFQLHCLDFQFSHNPNMISEISEVEINYFKQPVKNTNKPNTNKTIQKIEKTKFLIK